MLVDLMSGKQITRMPYDREYRLFMSRMTPAEIGAIIRLNRSAPMTNAQEKHLNRIAERKGFRLDKAGHGKGHGRFYIINLAEGGRMRSGVLDHEYSFSLEEAEAWLDTHAK
jgi:hypothetical protein